MALNSTSTIKIVDLLCEGPISGLVDGQRAVFFDETPIIASDGSRNFEANLVSTNFRQGGKTQAQLPESTNVASTVTEINQEIGQNYSETLDADNLVVARDYGPGSFVRQITDTDVDEIQLLFTIPRLFSTAQEGLAKGQLFDASVRIVIYIQSQESGFNNVYDKTITGIATSSYQIKTPTITLSGTGPWNVKVRKIDLGEAGFEVKYTNFKDIDLATSLANGRGNQLVWTSMVERQSLRVNYPYSALVGASISTEQFSRLPTRSYKVRGKIVQIPHNAIVRNDGSLDFDSNPTFNGSLKEAYTTCPVCCWYDMLTNSRYGAGDFVSASNVSWVDLYPLARYANQLVDTPSGGQEPRFACNVVIGDQAEAFGVLQDLASVFRGMLYWQANTIQATADHGNLDGSEVAPVHLYNNSSVVDGIFAYSGTSLKTRSTSIRVRYNDPDNFYKSNFVVVEDADLISKYGYQVKEVVGFGCTSRFQAQRLGRWMMASEELDGEIVNFSTGLTGAVVLPGQVFAIADEMRRGVRQGGRVSSATTTVVTIDQAASLPSGANPQLTCVLADGSVETRAISNTSDTNITVASAFTSAPLAQSVYSIATDALEEQKFRCLTVAENDDGTFGITGVQFNDSIYKTADEGADLEYKDITNFDETPPAPTNLNIAESQVVQNKNTINRLTISWSRGFVGGATSYEYRYKVANSNFVTNTTTDALVVIDNIAEGVAFTFEVRNVGLNLKVSKYTTASIIVGNSGQDPDNPGKILLPPSPANVTIQAIENNEAILRWSIPDTGQNKNDFRAIIRHSALTDGTGTWPNSTLIEEVTATTLLAVVPLMEGEYLVKFEDSNENRSANATSAVIDLPDAVPLLQISSRREDQDSPEFQGNRLDVFYSDEYDALTLATDSKIDDVTDNIDDVANIDFTGNLLQSGEYQFASNLDLGGRFNVKLTRVLKTRGIYPTNAIDSRTELIDRWTDIDGQIADDTSAEVYFRTSDQAPVDEFFLQENGDKLLQENGDEIQYESSVQFTGAWIPLQAGRYTGRVFQFKCELSSNHVDQVPLVDELGYLMQLERRIETGATKASGAAADVRTFTNAFYQEPELAITAFNLQSGDYYVITNASRTGFTVTFFNSSDTAVDRNYQFTATGFGTQL